ncbi:SPOR domain-containing protein [Oscillatoria sp. FACHB-1407]|uniref:SPOR domain-containing protein n=1 Tax=Oscillatoria sp. FACHB-1407 TaxID=2692847 RepID=UPI001683A8CD|nr:SPOR domain-containing protein [Oscillatoria sp. FACHB-1407]MBD2462605.1 SPOR domain-containing protein [Oscillatoria sp. FACHB-1407]
MRRRASAEPSSPEQFLNPVLKAALESLDVELDEELTRYRRMRGRKPGQTGRQRSDRQPDMIVIGASAAALSAASIADAPQAAPPLAIAADPNADPFADDAPLSSLAPFNPEVGQPLTEHNLDDLEPDSYLASSEELLKSIAEEEDLRAAEEPGMLESLLTPLGIGSMLLLLLSSITFGYLIMNPNSISILGLDKLMGDRASTPAQPNTTTTATTAAPASTLPSPNLADQEFVDLNLDTLSTLPTGESAPAGVATPGTTASPASEPNAATAVPQAPLPTVNLEQQTPVATASSTGPSRQRSQSAPRQRTESRQSESRSSNRAAAATRPAPTTAASTNPTPARSAAARPAAQSPAPAPSVATAPSAAPSRDNLYHVVTEYNGDRSLEQVRQVSGDAFLRNTNEGARVQAGAFSEQSRAEELVQELQQQGIPARIERR